MTDLRGLVEAASEANLDRILPPFEIPKRPKRSCTVKGCGGKHKALGFCAKHYASWRRTGSPDGLGKRGMTAPPPSHEEIMARCKQSWVEYIAWAKSLGIDVGTAEEMNGR